MVYHMIEIGEETGNMEDMLDKVAAYYDEEVESATEALLAAMELVIKPFADFYRNRFFDRFYRLINNLSCEFWIFHECRAFPVVHNLWHRAAHIQVKNIKWAILNLG